MHSNRKPLLLCCVLLLAGCSHDIKGPSPKVLSIEPVIVCNDHLVTEVTIEGDGMSPLVRDLLTIPHLQLPTVTLSREKRLDGTAAAGAAPVVVPDGGDGGDAHVRWTSRREMRFDVFPQLDLDEGIYAVSVGNGNGSSVSFPSALAAVPPPSVASYEPDLVCTADHDRQITVRGSGFLKIGAALPVVSVEGTEVTWKPDALAECTAVPGLGIDIQTCKKLTFTVRQGELEPPSGEGWANYEIFVTNPGPASCVTTTPVKLTVVPPPVVPPYPGGGIAPDVACTAQFDNVVEVTGTGFLDIDGALPSVRVGEKVYPAMSLDGCRAVEGPSETVRTCTKLLFTVPRGDLPPGGYDVAVTNPFSTDCTGASPLKLTVVPPPDIADVDPPYLCNEQADSVVTLAGTGFLSVDGALPSVSVGGGVVAADSVAGCTAVDGPHEAVRSCTTLVFTIPAGTLDPGIYDITVTNPAPADCADTAAASLTVVPPPDITDVDPPYLCNEQGDSSVTLTGTGFLSITGTLPDVTIAGRTYRADSVDGCAEVPGTGREVLSCPTLVFTIPAGTLDPGTYDITVTNPAPADCSDTAAASLTDLPPPDIADVEPPYLCNAQADSAVTLSGTSFLSIVGTLPDVTIAGHTYRADSVDGCAEVPGTGGAVFSCPRLVFTIPAGTLSAGRYDITVTNPAPADCTDTAAASLTVVPPPQVAGISPDIDCVEAGGAQFTLSGSGFVVDGSAYPTVHVGSASLAAGGALGCTDIPGGGGAQSCASVSFTVPAGAVAAGLHTVTATNPAPASCAAEGSARLYVAGPPSIAEVEPPVGCASAPPGQLTLRGAGFLVVGAASPAVTFDSTAVTVVSTGDCTAVTGLSQALSACTSVTVAVGSSLMTAGSHAIDVRNAAPAGCATPGSTTFEVALPPEIDDVAPDKVCTTGIDLVVTGSGFVASSQVLLGATPAASTTFVSAGRIDAHFAPLPGGVYDLTVSNGEGCEDTLEDAVTVADVPSLFFVDPPVVYNGISIRATVYASGIMGNVTGVSIVPAGGGSSRALEYTFNPLRPTRIIVTLPSGLAAGFWNMTVADDIGCTTTLANAFKVTATLRVAIAGIEPPFGWRSAATAVALTSPSPPPSGFVNYAATPRAYLNPHSPAPGDLASSLRSVAFVDQALLNGVVPEGMATGVYDLIVVNPDGGVGLLASAFTVTQEPPPVIDNVTPASVTNSGSAPVTAQGKNFRSPTARITCADPSSGAKTTLAATVTGSTAESASVTIPAGSLANGSVCVLRLTNGDGTWADYSAIAITNPSENLWPFGSGSQMVVARRAPAAAAGRATRVARFVYAAGGDSGTAAGAIASVEAAPVDLYGHMGSWRLLPNPLPQPRTLAGVARLGRYIYVVGGNNGGGGTDEVLRAKILDPDQTPEVTDIDIQKGTGAGLGGGTWYYVVSAVMGGGDADNPDGETLPSEPLVVLLPSITEKVHLTLFWSAVTGAAGYRIYRSPSADLIVGSERFLVQVGPGMLQYEDEGSLTTGSQKPLAIGDTGKWAPMPPLTGGAREGPGVAMAKSPASSSTYYLYAVGGRQGSVALASYAYATITVGTDGAQSMSAWTSGGANNLGVGRWQLGLFAMDHATASYIPEGDVWLYAAGGVNAAGTSAYGNVDAARVQAGGALTAWSPVDSMSQRAGFGLAGANNTLFVFGGANAAPSSGGISARICAAAGAGCPSGPPALDNWNSLGSGGLVVDRYLMGSAVESAFIFILGGATGGGAPTRTTESTVW